MPFETSVSTAAERSAAVLDPEERLDLPTFPLIRRGSDELRRWMVRRYA